jgi:hypothetical protein
MITKSTSCPNFKTLFSKQNPLRRISSEPHFILQKTSYKHKKTFVKFKNFNNSKGIELANYIQDFNFAQSLAHDQKHIYSLFALSLMLYTIDNHDARLKRFSFVATSFLFIHLFPP